MAGGDRVSEIPGRGENPVPESQLPGPAALDGFPPFGDYVPFTNAWSASRTAKYAGFGVNSSSNMVGFAPGSQV